MAIKIVEKAIDEIIPYDKNPRRNDEAVPFVKKSIEEFGFKVPVILDKNNVIVAGHTRVKAAKELGMKTVPCIMADDLSEEQVKAFRLADNKTGEAAGWDWELLEQELAEIANPLEAESIDMEQFGFPAQDDGDLQNIFEDAPQEHHETKAKTVTCPHCGETFEV